MVGSLSGLGPGDGSRPSRFPDGTQPSHLTRHRGKGDRIKNHLLFTGLLRPGPAAQYSDAAAGQGEVQG